ncbi:hypothetical protein BJX64DRAFT_280919 [Aspergillus heterothallicus]
MKCDRGEPCTPCRTAGQECVYVANPKEGDAAFRQKLVEMKDAKDALDGSLRPTLSEPIHRQQTTSTRRKRAKAGQHISSDESDGSVDDGYLQPTPLAVQDAAYGDGVDNAIDDLGVKIGRMRLGERIGGLFRPRIADEVSSTLEPAPQGRHPCLTASSPASDQQERSSPEPSTALFFGQVNTSAGVTDHIPPRHISDRLLSQYWSAVHPVARVVHRTSFAHRYETLWECIENGQQVNASLSAIVSAILLSAVCSMPSEKVAEVCYTSQAALQSQLKIGTELALNRARVLQTTRFEVLQAFIAYMLATSAKQITRAHSLLAGLLVRQAECMGLHRDPTEFGFSPIECHVRRLAWYQVCYLDVKSGEVQGPRAFIHHDGYTTQLPLDISLVNKSAGWNDMIFSLIRFECQEMQRRCHIHRNRVDLRRMTLTKAVSKIEEFRISMDVKYGPYINSVSRNPMQKLSAHLLKLWVRLLYILLLHRYMNSVTYRVPDRLRQIVLMKGTEALEAAVALESEEDLKTWAWYAPSYQQYHTAFLLLVEVFNYPRRREANRIWRCLDFIFAEPLASLPPFMIPNPTPTFDEIIEHRAVKARYVLSMISDQMRAYHTAKQSKLPATFNESMIVVTPQVAGDESDPRMPLNYAHGEPETSNPIHTRAAVHDQPPVPPMIQVSYPPPTSNPAPWGPYGQTLHDTTTPFPSSSGSSPWAPPSYAGSGGDQSEYVQQPVYTTNASAEDVLPTDIDPQLLEIDWDLWNTMFPPQANDGNLDVSDSCEWEPYGQDSFYSQGSFS